MTEPKESQNESCPSISVVVPAYNAQETLRETLDALLLQTYIQWECIIVDDGSSDSTLAIAREYQNKDNRFSVVTQENRGSGGAYNTGVNTATGDYICICSADDVLLPTHIYEIQNIMCEISGFDIYSTSGYFWYQDNSRFPVYQDMDSMEKGSLRSLVQNCFFGVGSLTKKSYILNVGGFDESVYCEDYDLWLRMMAAGAQHLLSPQMTALHRVSDFQKSADKAKLFGETLLILKRLLDNTRIQGADRDAVHARIKVLQFQLEHGGKTPEGIFAEEMELKSSNFRNRMESVFGVDGYSRIEPLLHMITKLVRPIREALIKKGIR